MEFRFFYEEEVISRAVSDIVQKEITVKEFDKLESVPASKDALLIHGHSAYSDDHPFQQMFRDVLAF
jgi:hypothetical protein